METGNLSKRLRVGFDKIDQDLAFLMETFAGVLRSTGGRAVAERLPWLGADADPDRPLDSNAAVQALSISFQLLNMVEENTANQMRRMGEREHGLSAEPGLWGFYLKRLRQAGWRPEDIAAALPHVRVEPVLTAHPTESKRVTVLEQHRALYVQLVQRENAMWTPAERAEIDRQIAVALERLWRTGETLLEKPTVASERAALLYYFDKVFPEALRRADLHLREAWADAGFDPALIADPVMLPRLRFGTWVGGERDGHPLVTPAVTRETFAELRRHALALQCGLLRDLRAKLSLSSQLQAAPASLAAKLAEWSALVDPEEAAAVQARNPEEPWRQAVSLMLLRMPPADAGTLQRAPLGSRHYRHAHQLTADLRALRASLAEVGAERIAQADVDPVLRAVEVFGFHLAALDIRQNSAFHDTAISQILTQAGLADPAYHTWDGGRRRAFLDAELERQDPLVGAAALSGPEAVAAVGALRELAVQRDLHGDEGIGTVILSMTRSVSDLLAVCFLAREAGLFARTDVGTVCTVPVAPLLETIDDLANGPAIIGEFLDHPLTRRSLAWFRRRHGKMVKKGRDLPAATVPGLERLDDFYQQVMIGYSDSNKDSGILAAQWAIHKAQRAIAAAADARGLRIRFFHGRGGTISRGAGPTHRFLEALPAGSPRFDLRVTEQGEVIAQKYGNLLTASYNLDLLLAGTAYFSLANSGSGAPDPRQHAVMESLAAASRAAYRGLLEADGFIDFYRQATPIDALEMSRIGSRPARRTGARSLADLRAIPWVFSWSQSRFFLPGWYGVGSALHTLEQGDPAGWELLLESIDRWPFLRYIVTNVETALLSSDTDLMRRYAGLVSDAATRERLLGRILGEHARALDGVRRLLGSARQGRRPRLEKTLAARALALRPLHLRQVELLSRWRAAGSPGGNDPLLQDILLTINAIAGGLRTTG